MLWMGALLMGVCGSVERIQGEEMIGSYSAKGLRCQSREFKMYSLSKGDNPKIWLGQGVSVASCVLKASTECSPHSLYSQILSVNQLAQNESMLL